MLLDEKGAGFATKCICDPMGSHGVTEFKLSECTINPPITLHYTEGVTLLHIITSPGQQWQCLAVVLQVQGDWRVQPMIVSHLATVVGVTEFLILREVRDATSRRVSCSSNVVVIMVGPAISYNGLSLSLCCSQRMRTPDSGVLGTPPPAPQGLPVKILGQG